MGWLPNHSATAPNSRTLTVNAGHQADATVPSLEVPPIRTLAITGCMFALLIATTTKATAATHWPTSKAAQRWKPDRGWLRGAFCIHNHESVDWHRNHIDWAGRPSLYSGGMQFLVSTWRNAGGLGDAWQWSPREQLYRSFRVWSADGGSWREWGTRGACGL